MSYMIIIIIVISWMILKSATDRQTERLSDQGLLFLELLSQLKRYSPMDLRTPCQARYVRCCGWDQKGVMATFSWRKTGPSTRGNLPSLQQGYL